jgi:peptide chain release factor subunit 1
MESEMDPIEVFKIKKLIKSLDAARGSGTSMISLIIPAGGSLPDTNTMLTIEKGTAVNVKSRVNRLSILSAITSTQHRLKQYNSRLPKNGLVVYCGTVITDEGKERKVTYDFEPFKPIKGKLYMCDNKFHVEQLSMLLEDNEVYGFIIIDGNGFLCANLRGNTYDIQHQFSVDLMTKTRRGGQSALRFARLREEQIRNFLRQAAEQCNKLYLKDNKLTVKGLIVAGNGNIKHQFLDDTYCKDLSPIVRKAVVQKLDIGYGGISGLQHAITQAGDFLSNIKMIEEKKLLQNYFEHISKDSKKFCYGIKEVMYCLEAGAVEKLIVWEDLPIIRYTLKHPGTESEKIVYKKQSEIRAELTGPDNIIYDIKDSVSLTEWLTENYKTFGVELVFVSDKSQEGNQFCAGFGGFGGILRWALNMNNIEYADADAEGGEAGDIDKFFAGDYADTDSDDESKEEFDLETDFI